MNEVEAWIYFDGPEPEDLRSFLDSIRDLPPLTTEDEQRMNRRTMAAIDAWLGIVDTPVTMGGDPPYPPAQPAAAPAPAAPPAPAQPPISQPLPAAAAWYPPPSAAPPSAPLPSAPAPSVSPPLPAPPPSGLPAVVTAPAALVSTAPFDASAYIPKNALPFNPDAPPKPRVAKTKEIPVMRPRGLAETTPIGDDSISKAVASVMPFLANTVGGGVIPIPSLSLEQYASLQAEMAYWPEHREQIRMNRYRVMNEAAHRALNQHWQKHFAEHPEDLPRYATALAKWTEHITAVFPK